ncbi:MAG: RNA methyltransferase, partial [Treponema sp.]|nr:RNA methyltransferase [Treponema sp.]
RINRLFLREDRFGQFTGVCKGLAARKRPYKVCDDEELERLCKSNRHQGVVMMIEEPAVEKASPADIGVWAAEGKTGLVLHSVGNDHNLGAIVRSAAFFDTAFVVISEKDAGAQLTTSAYRVAEGGMEHVAFRKVEDTAAFVRALSRSLVTVGTEPRARLRIRDLEAFVRQWQAPSPHPPAGRAGRPGIALVLGNEETGLPREVRQACSVLMRIPGSGNIESLNVAQAATVFLHAIYEL